MPGGGCLGAPETLDAALVAADVRAGLVSADAARDQYRVVVTPSGDLDAAATDKLRED